jgi:autotransporter strand-loop-strand O-heptosyltransferase
MNKQKIYAHGSYVGTTGYNNHTRDFFRELSKYLDIKIRNFTVGSSWSGYSETCHDGEPYIDELDKKLLYKQILWTGNGNRDDFPIYYSNEKEFSHDFNIILNETNHHLYYDGYVGPKIAFNVWESTRQPNDFFEKLKEFDELWVPSEWQKECTIEQGYDPNKIKVIPEGVDVHTFFPEKVDLLDEYKDGRFKFILFGRWDYRKSTKEIIETFISTFSPNEPVDLIVSIDNVWGEEMDGYKTTEERLEAYGITDPRVKVLHFPSREDYIKFIKTGHVFVSCARSEGWNLPLIEAMACGTPSIYSNCSGQLEFAKNKGLPVKIIGLKEANKNDYGRYTMSDLPGDYYVPDFDDLSKVMRFSYENYDVVKKEALKDSEIIRKEFSWEKIGEIGYKASIDFYNKINSEEFKNSTKENKIIVSYLDGPKVEIIGNNKKDYFVEFIDDKNQQVIYSNWIKNGMWTSCSKKYYVKWKIKINGEIYNEFNLKGKVVLISFESKSIGDTIAWAPYVVDFQKKHDCIVVLSTFHNSWFKDYEPYKNILFIEPGTTINCDVVYKIGYFKSVENKWNAFDFYPNQINLIPLQQTATDILGLEYEEKNYGVSFKPEDRPINEKYIVFAPQSTAGCKEWVYDNWVELSKILKSKKYKVITLTSKPYFIDGVKNINNAKWNKVFNYLYHAEFMVGLSSGLSWINWALGKKTVMISGFSEEFNEFKNNNIRISNNLCIKCWNDSEMVFDAGDWDWCPVYKGTKKQHICQKSITVGQVFKKIENEL